VADAVVDVKVGDTILVNWKNVTPPFESMFDGSRGDYGITDETQVEAIVS
jgi:hypothetical protein